VADEKETQRKPRVRRPRRRKKDEAETPKAAEATTEDAADETAEAAEEKPAAKSRAKAAKAAKTEKPKAEKKADAEAEADTEAAEADDAGEKAPPAKTKLPAGEKRPSKPRRGAAETAAPKTKPKSRRGGDAPADVEVRARAAYVRCAPRKARLVVDHIRGKSVEEARAILTHTPRAASRDVLKLLNSAVANAESNHELLADELRVHRVFVDEGPTLKRFRPRALGRATQIRKRTSHMTITLKPELAETSGKGKE
jgi:ribosomal protein L22